MIMKIFKKNVEYVDNLYIYMHWYCLGILYTYLLYVN